MSFNRPRRKAYSPMAQILAFGGAVCSFGMIVAIMVMP